MLVKKGAHCLGLADHKVTLAHDLEYKWSVAILPDKEQKPIEIVASGLFRFVRLSEELAKRLPVPKKVLKLRPSMTQREYGMI